MIAMDIIVIHKFSHSFQVKESTLLFLPVDMEGLGIQDSDIQVEQSYRLAKMATMEIVSAIRGDQDFQ